MNIVLEQENPLSCLDEIGELFARAGKPKCRKFFEWYYENKGYGSAVSWVLRERSGARILGLLSIVPRDICFHGRRLRAGVPGNYTVDPDARSTMAAMDLLRAGQSLVDDRQLDILLGIRPNDASMRLGRRLGFRTIGRWRTYAYVFRSSRGLKSKLGLPGAVVGPAVDAAAALRRAFKRRRLNAQAKVETREMAGTQIHAISADKWLTVSDRFTAKLSKSFVSGQFLFRPDIEFRIFGVFLQGSDRAIGLVATIPDGPRGKVEICYCVTDQSHIAEHEAIISVVRNHRKGWGIWHIDALEDSDLASNLARAGFDRIPARGLDRSAQLLVSDRPDLIAYWRTDHALADAFSRATEWDLYIGLNDS